MVEEEDGGGQKERDGGGRERGRESVVTLISSLRVLLVVFRIGGISGEPELIADSEAIRPCHCLGRKTHGIRLELSSLFTWRQAVQDCDTPRR